MITLCSQGCLATWRRFLRPTYILSFLFLVTRDKADTRFITNANTLWNPCYPGAVATECRGSSLAQIRSSNGWEIPRPAALLRELEGKAGFRNRKRPPCRRVLESAPLRLRSDVGVESDGTAQGRHCFEEGRVSAYASLGATLGKRAPATEAHLAEFSSGLFEEVARTGNRSKLGKGCFHKRAAVAAALFPLSITWRWLFWKPRYSR